ncbi:MAG: hypothetical protein KGI26_06595 [Thaumarchaeota archaeon]|nr:hypothetical protein [Nitrososphaerota archaeon]
MDERRFGLGLAVGVLLGVVVVAASGGLAAAQLMWLPASANEKALTTTLTQTTTALAPQTPVSMGANGTQGLPLAESTTTVSSGATSNLLLNVGAIQAALPSTRYAAIASQSSTANALLIVPVAVALLLGAFVYRVYAKRKTADEED